MGTKASKFPHNVLGQSAMRQYQRNGKDWQGIRNSVQHPVPCTVTSCIFPSCRLMAFQIWI